MRSWSLLILAGLLHVAVTAGHTPSALAQTMPPQRRPVIESADRPRASGVAVGAAALNLLYVPIRLAYTGVGVALSSVTGLLTAGNQNAADDVWAWFEGQAFLTPAILRGEEALRVGLWRIGRDA
jgi:hypothetical protein